MQTAYFLQNLRQNKVSEKTVVFAAFQQAKLLTNQYLVINFFKQNGDDEKSR